MFSFIIILFKYLLGIGDWGWGIGPNPQSPIPNPHMFNYDHYVQLFLKIIFISNKVISIIIYMNYKNYSLYLF